MALLYTAFKSPRGMFCNGVQAYGNHSYFTQLLAACASLLLKLAHSLNLNGFICTSVRAYGFGLSDILRGTGYQARGGWQCTSDLPAHHSKRDTSSLADSRLAPP